MITLGKRAAAAVLVVAWTGATILSGQAGVGVEREAVLEHVETQDPGYLKLPVRILDRSTYDILTFRPERGETATISFRLTRPAEIRLRLVRRDRPELVVRTLLDWTLLGLGRHELRWDGRDASGRLGETRRVKVIFEGKSRLHKRHVPARCHEPRIELDPLPRPATGPASVEVRIVDETSESDFRMRAWVDWRPWTDERFSGRSHVLELPADEDLGPGEHVLVVNVDDGEDHVGSASMLHVAWIDALTGATARSPGSKVSGK